MKRSDISTTIRALLVSLVLASGLPAQPRTGEIDWDMIVEGARRPSDDLARTSEEAPPVFNPLSGFTSRMTTETAAPEPGKATEDPVALAEGTFEWTTLVDFEPEPGPEVTEAGPGPEKPKPPKTKPRPPKKKPKPKKDKAEVKGERIVAAAHRVLQNPPPYHPATQGGRLGCAQIVSTILKNAGMMKNVMLGVLSVLDDLRKRNWRQVKPPPWKDGDVITWATYDRSGDGRIDPDTHIGVIEVRGGKVWAINNSSSRRRPVRVELSAMNYPVSRVMRPPG